ncbi:suppressor of cytokine signaling 3-like [Rhopilema esculentum]|uniref:suppressor of cytokine signaling 3-like n=1 Tax=Rhopilema esculentum TaxID=499914 RepID=UPI0031D0F7A3|eukprot:gene13319-4165_t
MKLFSQKPRMWIKKLRRCSIRTRKDEHQNKAVSYKCENNAIRFIEDKYVLSTVAWYWPDIDGYSAARLLHGHKNGTFLVRKSSMAGFMFTLTYIIDNKVGNLRVHCKNGLFSLCFHDLLQPREPTLQMLVEKLVAFSSNGSFICGLRRETDGKSTNVPLKLETPLRRNVSLQDLCRKTIMRSLCNANDVSEFDLPASIKDFLLELNDRE